MTGVAVRNSAKDTRIESEKEDKTSKDRVSVYSEIQIETAQYIADMILELRNMAKGVALYATMVPLEYAYYEAFSVANRVRVPQHEAERINRLGDDARAATPPVSAGRR